MVRKSLEQRVAMLEEQVQQLLATTPPNSRWRETVGMFSGDELMKEIDAAGAAWREADRKRARRPRKQRAKS